MSKISTHTPLTGCNSAKIQMTRQRINFYSHTPHGVQHKDVTEFYIAKNFYSHTPHGVQLIGVANTRQQGVFLLTHPSRGATLPDNVNFITMVISTHTPLTGCNTAHVTYVKRGVISTHTPLTGCNIYQIMLIL